MIRYIAHRGNLNGPNPQLENRPDYIKKAIKSGFDAEIDVWVVHGDWWLGHDEPSWAIEPEFLLGSRLWIHAKHPQALAALLDLRASLTSIGTQQYGHLNFFFHETDEVTLTSGGYVWTYPKKVPSITTRTVIVLPENDYIEQQYLMRCSGVCSDYIQNIHAFLPNHQPEKAF